MFSIEVCVSVFCFYYWCLLAIAAPIVLLRASLSHVFNTSLIWRLQETYVINTCLLLRLCSPSSPTSLFFNFSQFAARERDGAAGNGAEKQIIRPGTGPKRAPDQTVTVHCTGFGKGGDLSQQFWSTKDAGQKPFSFIVGKGAVIKGVIGMQIGEVARLRVCRLLFSSCKHI
ncbi:PREDICTED: uncharacterized protein LOC106303148 [Brassica oleracea var. oleracea]|uniref:uncharacterized protein LOC106303148 n=1 Tax=Brassica oleracea var. oleracea TaxID=109376 RepID=UPI0006A745CC|nr:PREDICTED: uncharacterized protein LOC106303148 [Brassica oleracea var. oleracea]